MSTQPPPQPATQPTAKPAAKHRPKPPKPRLPLSAFSPPNTGASDSFPVQHDPVAADPKSVVDANVIVHDADYTYSQWKSETGISLGSRIGGIVVSLPGANLEEAASKLQSSDVKIISLSIPFKLEDTTQTIPDGLANASIPISFSTVFNESTDTAADSLNWALKQGKPVDIDIEAPISNEVLDSFEEIIEKATKGLDKIPPIILSNVLPPPHDLELPIVKLMDHPTYLAFQAQIATLSLFPYVSIKFLPPSWDAPTPPTPSVEVAERTDSQQKREWKRRIKMYLSPVIEAFGYQRIIFGSSPCPSSTGSSIASDWYEMAKESLLELGVDQETVDAVFSENAKRIYGTTA